MNKNLKIVSSLALAGILATSGLSGAAKVLAAEATNDVRTLSLGKYASLGGVTNVVPYILRQNDSITIADLKSEFKASIIVNNNAALSENTILGTGDTFKISGDNKVYTVLVYGDVNGDGKVNAKDATETLKYSAKKASAIDKGSLYREAANVERTNTSTVNSIDATRMLKFSAKKVSTSRDGKPDDVKPVADGYTLTVGENNVINNQNNATTGSVAGGGLAGGFSLVLELDNANISNEEDRTLSVKVYDKDNKEVTGTSFGAWTLGKNTNRAELDKLSLATNVNSIANGTYTFEVTDTTNDIVLARQTVTVKSLTPTAAKIVATRAGATAADLSLQGYGESKITGVEYSVTTSGSTTTGKFENLNNILDNERLNNVVFPDTAQAMTIVLVDEYGNKSNPIPVMVPAHDATAETAVTKVTAPTLETLAAANDLEFTITGTIPTDGAEAVVYDKDGNIVYAIPLAASASTTGNLRTYITKAGKYRVGVTVNGNAAGSTTNSAEVLSDYIEIEELAPITNVNFGVEKDGTKKLTWTDSNAVNKLNTTTPNTTQYTFTFEYLDGNNGYVALPVMDTSTPPAVTTPAPTLTVDAAKHEATITANLDANKIYRVKIEANPNAAQSKYIKASETEKYEFFYIDTSSLFVSAAPTSKTYESLTYAINPIMVNGVEATYKAIVNPVYIDGEGSKYTLEENKVEKPATRTTGEDGTEYLTIENLANGQQYTIKIVATVGNAQGESELKGYTPGVGGAAGTYATDKNTKTYAKTPAISGYTVVKPAAEDLTLATAKTIYKNASGKLIIDGKTTEPITVGVANNDYTPEFNAILDLISNSLINEDRITIDSNNDKVVTLSLKNTSKSVPIALDSKFEGFEVTVEGVDASRDIDRVITTTAAATTPSVVKPTKLAKLNVKGNGLIAAITNNDSANTPVYLYNGAHVTGSNTYTVVKGATAKIDGIDVNTDKADTTIISAGSKTLTVQAPENALDTNLTFTNSHDNRYTTSAATIKFAAKDNTSRILGTVTIVSTEGDITVSPDNTGVLNTSEMNLVVDTTHANNVTIDGFTDAHEVSLKVKSPKVDNTSKTTTVTAKLGKDKIDMLNKLSANTTIANGDSITLKAYKDSEAMELNATGPKNVAQADRKVMQEFIDSFGINNKNVVMTFTASTLTNGAVTIAVTDTEVDLSGFATHSNK